MIKNKSDLNDEFLKDFPKIYQNPSSTNSYLAENTSRIEEKIINYFKQYELDKDFAIYANGGFGRKELYPSSVKLLISSITFSKDRFLACVLLFLLL